MEKEEKIKAFLEHLLTKHDSYHHQKENISHAGIVLQIALFIGIISLPDTAWIKDFTPVCIQIALFSVLWLLIHIFIRVQLRLKRWAAINYAGCFRAYRKFTNTVLKKDDFETSNIKGFGEKKILSFFDLLIPISEAPFKSDIGKNDYPRFIVASVQEQYDQYRTGSTKYEWIFAIASFLMLSIAIYCLVN